LFPEITKKVEQEHQKSYEQNLKNNPNNEYYKQKREPNNWQYINKISETIKVKSYYYDEDIQDNPNIYINSSQYNLFPLNISN
jgi:hypothetical protein